MSDTILKVVNLAGQSPDGFKISNISLELKRGEIHVIVGENNSGQKSFVSVLAGITPLEEGQVFYDGQHLSPKSLLNRSNQDIAFLFQENSLVRHLTVAENLWLNRLPKIRGTQFIHWRKIKKKSEEVLQHLNIHIHVKEKVARLTQEQCKLLEIAKTFMHSPQLVVLHEPTENLSTSKVSTLFKILQEYKQHGGSVIYVTKNWEEALKIADNISVLSKGKSVGKFTAAEAKNDPRKLLRLLDSYSFKKDNSVQDSHLDIKYDENEEVLNSVFRAAELLTSEYELKDVLLFLAQSVSKAMNCDGTCIDLLDYSTRTKIDTYVYHKDEPLHVKVREDFVFQLLDEDTLFYSNHRDKEFCSYFKEKGQVKTLICVPLSIRSRVAGVIQIFYKETYVHSKEEAKYLMAFAQQAAISIEDTRLIGRSAMLQESHHRIKNNLQAISSYIALQKRYISQEYKNEVENILDNTISRIKSIAAVHDLLSKDQLGRSIINIKELISVIIEFSELESDVDIEVDFEDMFIPYSKATSIALLINELICNCNKYAFTDQVHMDKKVMILGYKKHNGVYVQIHDNGKGFPPNFNIEKDKSLGLTIVTSMIKNEFKGVIEFTNDSGAKVNIRLDSERIFLGR